MQELTSAPQMASPYTPAGGSNMPALTAQQPKLGTPIPGTTGGLAAKPGLTVYDNPLSQQLQSNPQQAAQQTQSYGRGEDSVLVHMTPNEVNSLRGLAMQFGGDLTTNPHTGLPEAGWLGKLLPTILGIAGAAFGIPTWAIGLGVGAGQTALTGDLGKGLSAGLQAFGGAGLGQAAGVGGSLGHVGQSLGLTQNATGASGALSNLTSKAAADQAAVKAGTLAADKATSAGFLSKFGAEAGLGQKGLIGKSLPVLAGTSVLGGISKATQPKMKKYKGGEEESSWNYEGPYLPSPRQVSLQTPEQMRESGGAEYTYFTPSNPAPGYRPMGSLSEEERGQYGFADGGLAALPASDKFSDLVEYFGSTSPGAITASMYPTRSAAPAAPAAPTPPASQEQTYDFQRPTTPTAPTGSNTSPWSQYFGGTVNIPGVGSIQLPDFSNYDWGNMDWNAMLAQGANQTQPTTPSAPPVQDQLANLGYPDMSSLPSPLTRNPLVAEAQAANPMDIAPSFDYSQ